MRLLISWVRDFVDVTAPAPEIAEKLALRGFEIAEIEPLAAGDAVIDFEVTANRPDCLSVVGFAREIATLYNLPLRQLSQAPDARLAIAPLTTAAHSGRLEVTLEDPDLCPRYAAAVADVTAAASPAWMRDRLQSAGIRPISPIVDVTNYVLVELGHPMHAFDLTRLAGGALRIRRARRGETLTTLDGVARTLDPDMLVIADAERPQAVAGVMGGADSEVSASTRTVAFESAYFKPASVRRTSKKLGLKTEASTRFERGTDINAPMVALQRAVALMELIGAGKVSGPAIDRYPEPRGPKPLRLRRERLAMLLGMTVPDREVDRILGGLGLAVTPAPEGWNVLAPTFRVDLLREVDLIEEVGRHYGFDRLEPSFPPMAAAAAPPDARLERDRLIRQTLTAAGFSEAITFAITDSVAVSAFVPEQASGALVGVANPLSAKFDMLRPTLLAGLVDAVAHNRRHGRRDVALFEIGATFTVDGERHSVALAWTGSPVPEHWSTPSRDVDFFDVKGVVEQLCQAIGTDTRLERGPQVFLADGQSAAVMVSDRRIGIVGQVTPDVVERRGAPRADKVYVAELDLDAMAALARPHDVLVRALPRYPTVVRDLSIVVSATLPAEIIRGTIHATADAAGADAAPLVSVAFFDRYQGKGVADGSVSLSVRLTFQAPDRTLTDAEVQGAFDTILAALVREHAAVQR
jgi:phenylalanyl-tRNA synthetase beta chain